MGGRRRKMAIVYIVGCVVMESDSVAGCFGWMGGGVLLCRRNYIENVIVYLRIAERSLNGSLNFSLIKH